MRIAALLSLTFLVFQGSLGAQAPVEPGQRVRVTAPDLGIRKQAARFEAFRGDTLVVAAADSTMTLPVASVTRLEVSRGRKSHTLTGALVGLLVGAASGAALINAEDLPTLQARGEGAVVGTLLGAITGASIKTDRWEEVPLERLSVSFAPQRDGRFALGVSVGF